MLAETKRSLLVLFYVWLNACALVWMYEAKRPPALICAPVKVTLQVGPAGDKIIPETSWDDGTSFVVPCLVKGAKSATPPIVIPENHSVRMKAVYIEAK